MASAGFMWAGVICVLIGIIVLLAGFYLNHENNENCTTTAAASPTSAATTTCPYSNMSVYSCWGIGGALALIGIIFFTYGASVCKTITTTRKTETEIE